MTRITSRTGWAIAASAAALSMISASRGPSGYAWAVLACATGLLVARRSQILTLRPSDAIRDVDAGPPRLPVGRGCGLTTIGPIVA